jgi:hypothetical protein
LNVLGANPSSISDELLKGGSVGTLRLPFGSIVGLENLRLRTVAHDSERSHRLEKPSVGQALSPVVVAESQARSLELKHGERPILVDKKDVEPAKSDLTSAPVDLQIFVTKANRKSPLVPNGTRRDEKGICERR